MPTSAQRQNEKSGVALQRIQQQEAVGSFHFTDNYDRMIENCGRKINRLLDKVYDTQRQVPGRNKKGESNVISITTAEDQKQAQEQGQEPQGDQQVLTTGQGEFEVTIGEGPSYESQRELASDFVDTLVTNIKGLPIPPQIAQQLLALAIKLKHIGPIGDEIHDLLMPPDPNNLPPQAQAALQQAQATVQQLQQELQQLQQEKEGKVLDNVAKSHIAQMKAESDQAIAKMNNEVKIALAEITTKAQILNEREAFVADLEKQLHMQAHERGMQAVEHSHAKTVGALDASHESAMSAQEADQSGAQAEDQRQHEAEQAALAQENASSDGA